MTDNAISDAVRSSHERWTLISRAAVRLERLMTASLQLDHLQRDRDPLAGVVAIQLTELLETIGTEIDRVTPELLRAEYRQRKRVDGRTGIIGRKNYGNRKVRT